MFRLLRDWIALLKQVLDALDLLDHPSVNGAIVAEWLHECAGDDSAATIRSHTVTSSRGSTDFVKVTVPGSRGRAAGGDAPTLGVIGRLGGIGARPEQIGFVSDGDGAAAALALAAKALHMGRIGDRLIGDVMIATHVCPDAPTIPHDPVPFMDSPVDMATMNANEVDEAMDAIISIDTTKGNRVINHRGIAISNTVKEGYILPVSADLVATYETVCGIPAQVFPLSVTDITPYGNGLHHINSILQPATATSAPVVGVAVTAQTVVAGSATGASQETDIALAARYALEVARRFGAGQLAFFDADEYTRLVALYGSAAHVQTDGKP